MPNPSYGLIVEGTYDEAAYRELVNKLVSPRPDVIPIVCGGAGNLMDRFPDYLSMLQYHSGGRPVDKALVIRDSDYGDPMTLQRSMAGAIRRRRYAFPRGVQICVVRRALETLLLADANALSCVIVARRGKPVKCVSSALEDIQRPKEELKRILEDARVPYTPIVGAEIMRESDISVLKARCPSFVNLERSILDC